MRPDPIHQPASPQAPAVLKIDLSALQANYQMLAELAAPAECAAVVKANAYGLGIRRVAPAIWKVRCRSFFVATLYEALELRSILGKATIYVMNGLPPGTAPLLEDNLIRPVLCSVEEVREWAAHCKACRIKLPAALHVESGINRLGLSSSDIDALVSEPALFDTFDLSLVMSHLACGDNPTSQSNQIQRQVFERLRTKLPTTPASLANSSGILLGADFHCDLVRAGISIYGGGVRDNANPVSSVVHLFAKIAQVRSVPEGQKVGYDGTWTAERDSKIAVIPVGYADGYRRSLSSSPDQPDARVWIGGHFAPVIGRVSMDMITVDVTDLPDDIAVCGAEAELFGSHVTAGELAVRAGTIDHEIFTGLGSRLTRIYST